MRVLALAAHQMVAQVDQVEHRQIDSPKAEMDAKRSRYLRLGAAI